MPERRRKGALKRNTQAPVAERHDTRSHAVWSGTISFGLVSLPVDLFPAQRGAEVALRMVDEDGTPLRREYFCPRDEKPLDRNEIVRGYEVAKGEFVVITDEELEAIAPEKSREIALRRFVRTADIDPMYFERPYFLAPATESTRAYHLLAEVMEREARAGIATFVMRGKEYLVALLARDGLLRAETLRFCDSLRSAEDAGLPVPGTPQAARVRPLLKAIRERSSRTLDRAELADRWAERVQALVRRKVAANRQVVKGGRLPDEPESSAQVIDLMAILTERLQGKPPRESSAPMRGNDGGEAASRQSLYERARALGIPRRSRMSKRQLLNAIRRATG